MKQKTIETGKERKAHKNEIIFNPYANTNTEKKTSIIIWKPKASHTQPPTQTLIQPVSLIENWSKSSKIVFNVGWSTLMREPAWAGMALAAENYGERRREIVHKD